MNSMGVMMALLLFLCLSSPSTRAETKYPKQISNGSSLIAGTSAHPSKWHSPTGLFAFGFYPQGTGFAVGIWLDGDNTNNNSRTVVWTANRDDPSLPSNAKLQLTADGKLVVQSEQGQEKLIADVIAPASSASMLDSGNFVLYSKNSSIIWQSFDYPTDTLLGGQTLRSEGRLVSGLSESNRSTGRFYLKMQGDGNLVLYPLYTVNKKVDAYWATDTNPRLNGFKLQLFLNKTGNLVIRNGSHSNLTVISYLYSGSPLANDFKNESGNQTICRATLDYDGVFRLYVHVNNGISHEVSNWPNNACQVKGFRGFNSFCTLRDDQPYCSCLPGFDFIDPNQNTLGCKRNFSEAECRGDKATSYNMLSMKNISWRHDAYSELQVSKEEECVSSCLTDCICDAALYVYNQGLCRKQHLPLSYVRRPVDNENNTAFIKVPEPDQSILSPPVIKSISNKAIWLIILVTSGFILPLSSAIGISFHFIHKIRRLRYKRLLEIGDSSLNEVALSRFSYNELKMATNHFKQELGKGSFGTVYKGALYKGTRLIAVKRLEKLVEEGEREFQAEMRAIGKTHHRNLVRLLGYCVEGSKRLLVYEYMTNGSLAKLLFGAKRRPDWDERVRIAVDIARGILYLHEECKAPIIHCDIKPQNILMDDYWTAKISDFGLAKLLMPDQTRTFTRIRGTRGYVAPEWDKNIPISVKADVYSYGIVLLEILCCRRNLEVNVSEPEEIVLSSWAYKCFVAGELNKLVNGEIVDKNVLENMVKVALWCIQDEPILRPTMKSVVLMLEGVTNIAIPPCPNSNYM